MTQTDSAAPRLPRVLFLCTGNTARSQLAQALLEHRAGARVEVMSAGLEPGQVNPMTVKALEELGLPTGHLAAKGVKPLIAEHFTDVITVCDRAEASCPIFPNARYRLSWPFEDPAAATGTDHVYRQLATSVGAGTRAAMSAERALAALELETAQEQ